MRPATSTTTAALRTLRAPRPAPVPRRRAYATYGKDETLQSRASSSNYSRAAADGMEGSTAQRTTAPGAPPATSKAPPTSRPIYMVGIGAAVLGLGYGFVTLLSNPRKAVAHHDTLPDALTPGKGVDAASRPPSRVR